jgi:hypothetical protein
MEPDLDGKAVTVLLLVLTNEHHEHFERKFIVKQASQFGNYDYLGDLHMIFRLKKTFPLADWKNSSWSAPFTQEAHNNHSMVSTSVALPWHFGKDPDPAISVSDLQEGKNFISKYFGLLLFEANYIIFQR